MPQGQHEEEEEKRAVLVPVPLRETMPEQESAHDPPVPEPPSSVPIFRPVLLAEQQFQVQGVRRVPSAVYDLSMTPPSGEQPLRGDQTQTSERLKKLFDGLTSGDAVRMLEAAAGLASELAMSQDSAVSATTLETFVDPLVACLRTPPVPEIICNIFDLNLCSARRKLLN